MMFAVEIHRSPHTKRITEELIRHAHVLQEGSLAAHFVVQSSHHVLSIHENVWTFDTVRQNMLQLDWFEPFMRAFMFNT